LSCEAHKTKILLCLFPESRDESDTAESDVSDTEKPSAPNLQEELQKTKWYGATEKLNQIY